MRGDFVDAQAFAMEQVDDRALFLAQPCDRRREIGLLGCCLALGVPPADCVALALESNPCLEADRYVFHDERSQIRAATI